MTTFLINLVQLLIFPGLLFCVVFGVLMAGIDRKLVARMQRRVGPPILQPWYDFVKCCAKETIIPRHAKKALFIGAPYLGLASLIVIALFIPVSTYGSAFSAGADLVVILYLLTIAGVALIIGAAASGSPFAGVGLSREMVAMISYELPFVLVLLAVGRVAGAGDAIGCTVDYMQGRNRYISHLIASCGFSLQGLKIGLDCAKWSPDHSLGSDPGSCRHAAGYSLRSGFPSL